jgi:hypothetical protein
MKIDMRELIELVLLEEKYRSEGKWLDFLKFKKKSVKSIFVIYHYYIIRFAGKKQRNI